MKINNGLLSYRIIISLVLLCAAMISCSETDIPDPDGGDNSGAVISGDNVTLYASVAMPDFANVATRSLSATLSLPDMHLYAVEFTDEGNPLLNTYIRTYEAENEVVAGDFIKFKLTIRATTRPRLLHLIALPKGETLDVSYGIEAAVVPALTTSDGVDAYWRRLRFPSGYCIEAGGGEWKTDPKVTEALTGVRLIRNFAKISMKSEAADFTLQGFEVLNIAGKGSIAPWNPVTRQFPEFLDADGEMRDYESLADDYEGFLPADTPVLNQDAGPSAPLTFGLEDKYFYERPFEPTERSFIIVKGLYKGEVNYYKLDIGKNDQNGIFRYYHLIRNYNFIINIKSVSASGYEDADLAANGSVYNNISFDIDLSHLMNMSDGKEIVYVGYTTKVLTSPTPEDIDFQFRYVNMTSGASANTGYRLVGLEPGDVIQSVSPEQTFGDWRLVPMTIRPATPETKMQRFCIVKPSSGLGRNITLILHSKWDFTYMRAYPLYTQVWSSGNMNRIRKELGKEFTMFFDLPPNINESVFPLDIVIESYDQVIENEPGVGYMDVKSGESLFGNGQVRIQYHRHVTWTQYSSRNAAVDPRGGATDGLLVWDEDGNLVPRVYCHFRTTQLLTAGQVYKIRVHNVNFNDETLSVTAY